MKFSSSLKHSVAFAALLAGLTFAAPTIAAPDTSEPPTNTMNPVPPNTAPGTNAAKHHHEDNNPQAMAQKVEERITSLHDKLKITSAQEDKFNVVAQTMRDNESSISQLIQDRHANRENMTAVDDLQSYEKIAQAHVEGLQKLIPAFQSLYNDLSDDQKKNADQVFGRFEGHDMMGGKKKHEGSTK